MGGDGLNYFIVLICNQTMSRRFSGRERTDLGLKRKEGAGPMVQLRCCLIVEFLLASQMLIEELQDSAVAFNLIFLFRKTMAFIWKDHIFHGDSVLFHCSHNVI